MKRAVTLVSVIVFVIASSLLIYMTKQDPWSMAMLAAVKESSTAPYLDNRDRKTIRFHGRLPAHVGGMSLT